MKRILILGAGLSTSSLIGYLLKHSEKEDWHIIVGDVNPEAARGKIRDHPRGEAISLDIFNEAQKEGRIREADLVISMLPARFHPMVAEACLEAGRNLLTASYVSSEIRRLDYQARQKGLLFFNELGVDPGIDHMSAMRIINTIRNSGGHLTGFRSYTGGLIAPESDNNPWHYKFTWNPRNVVLAGQGTSMYLLDEQYKYIPYHQLFRRIETTSLLELGDFEVYANRDSLQYRDVYNLPDIKTLIRGTLRRPGYCRAWDVFVQLGMTDDSYTLDHSERMTWHEFFDTFLPGTNGKKTEERLSNYLALPAGGEILNLIRWLGLFEDTPTGMKNATPAQLLQHKLEEKWKLDPGDQDMIVMQHIFDYEYNDRSYRHKSSLVVIGKDSHETAMAITVGIPLGIAARLVMTGTIRATGVQVPILPEFYLPILRELEEYGIRFIEEETQVQPEG